VPSGKASASLAHAEAITLDAKTEARACASFFGLAGAAIIVALVGVLSLPATNCGEYTPWGETTVLAAIAIGSLLFLIGVSILGIAAVPCRLRLSLALLGAAELAAGCCLFAYYSHQTAGYGICG
jgi:hypothetical protein